MPAAYATVLRQLHLISRLQRFPGKPAPFAELRRYPLEEINDSLSETDFDKFN